VYYGAVFEAEKEFPAKGNGLMRSFLTAFPLVLVLLQPVR
jgi:hypothetical protein